MLLVEAFNSILGAFPLVNVQPDHIFFIICQIGGHFARIAMCQTSERPAGQIKIEFECQNRNKDSASGWDAGLEYLFLKRGNLKALNCPTGWPLNVAYGAGNWSPYFLTTLDNAQMHECLEFGAGLKPALLPKADDVYF